MKFKSAAFLEMKWIGILCILFAFAGPARAQTTWILKQSTLTYHVTHPLHHAAGVSHAARGKGICNGGKCTFLVAVPVDSFKSGDTNRDLHMLQITRGAQYPMVVVRGKLPENELKNGTLHADFQIQFAGQTASFKQVPFQVKRQANDVQLNGTIPATLTDFKIPAPELLFVPIRNQIPVTVQMTWQEQK